MREREGQVGNCPVCHRGDLITITMTVADRDLSFAACHVCEAKWWKRDGEDVELGSVLNLVTQPNPTAPSH